MARHPLFLDDDRVAAALEDAAEAALDSLLDRLPELDRQDAAQFRHPLRRHLAALLTGRPGASSEPQDLPRLVHGEDAFGDSFSLEGLPLARPGTGYAVQLLDTDTLLDRESGQFRAVRDPALKGLFDSFESAHAAARAWLKEQNAGTDRFPLAIVPSLYDYEMRRHVLIYGVLTQSP